MLVFIILKKEEMLDALIEAMLEAEIEPLTLFDGTEAEKVLSQDIPIFAGLYRAMTGERGTNKTVLGITESKQNLMDFDKITREISGLHNCIKIIGTKADFYS